MPHDHDPHNHGHEDDGFLPDLLDLDGRVLADYWTSALDLVVAHAPADVCRIVDLGAGSGTAAVAFARRYPAAEVIAVDADAAMLDRLKHNAGDTVRPLLTDLDADWPITDPVDITWASMSLHHLADPGAVLQQVAAATRPGGIVAIAEFASPLRFLPDDLGVGRPGLEQRLDATLTAQRAQDLPELGADWPAALERAGLIILAHRDLAIDVRPHDDDGRRYAELWLQRLNDGLSQHLDPDDRGALALLLDDNSPHSVRQRNDLNVRGVRTVTVAQRS